MWLYKLTCLPDSQVKGPLNTDEIAKLFRNGAISRESLVRSASSEGEFQTLDQSDVWQYLGKGPLSEMPTQNSPNDDFILGSRAAIWYYDQKGSRVGPVSGQIISRLQREGDVDTSTLVWRNGFSDWKRLGDVSELISQLDAEQAPPPLPISSVPNWIVWIIALTPAIGYCIEYVLTYNNNELPIYYVILSYIVFYSAMAMYDESKLRAAGHAPTNPILKLIVPGYLFARANSLRELPSYALVWCILFLATVVATYTGMNNNNKAANNNLNIFDVPPRIDINGSNGTTPLSCTLVNANPIGILACDIMVDKAIIKKVDLNRGRCMSSDQALAYLKRKENALIYSIYQISLAESGLKHRTDELPLSLAFGEKLLLPVVNCENLLEWTITVNDVAWTFQRPS